MSKASYSDNSISINRNNSGTSNGKSVDIVIINPTIAK